MKKEPFWARQKGSFLFEKIEFFDYGRSPNSFA